MVDEQDGAIIVRIQPGGIVEALLKMYPSDRDRLIGPWSVEDEWTVNEVSLGPYKQFLWDNVTLSYIPNSVCLIQELGENNGL